MEIQEYEDLEFTGIVAEIFHDEKGDISFITRETLEELKDSVWLQLNN